MRKSIVVGWLSVACASGAADAPDKSPAPDQDTAQALDTSASTDSGTPAGCGATTWTSGRYSVDHNGVSRDFQVHVPASYDPSVPAPLIVAFHGWGGDDSEFLSAASVTAEADARGYVVVAPVGLGAGPPDRSWSSWSFRGSTTGIGGDGLPICDDAVTPDYTYDSCAGIAENGCAWTHCQDDDVAFVLELVASAQDSLCIDPARVFAVGGSNGGMFSWELGQNAASAGVFRAIAPIIGLPHRGHLAPPAKAGGMPVLLVTGTADRTVPPGDWEDPSPTTTTDGDTFYYTGATAITQSWAEAAGCDVSTPASVLDVGVPEVECRSYCAYGDTWPTVLDCRADVGHTYQFRWSWPLVLDFFDQQR